MPGLSKVLHKLDTLAAPLGRRSCPQDLGRYLQDAQNVHKPSERRSPVKSITLAKGLRDVRTGISTHSRSTPRVKGSTYLEVFSLDKEKLRLETELAQIAKRQRSIERRLGEVREAMGKLLAKAGAEGSPVAPHAAAPTGKGQEPGAGGSGPRQWHTMPVEY